MSIPQTPSPLSNILAAKTYNAAWFSGVNKETQITNAIAAAVTDGALYVYVPANMLPYTSSLVTFNTAISMLCEGADFGSLDLLAYGADPLGVLDSTAALAGALARLSAVNGGKLQISLGTFNVNRSFAADNITSNNITIEGTGPGSIFNGSFSPIGASNGNESYNIFQATGRTGLTIRNVAMQGYGTLCSFSSCTNVDVYGCSFNGLLANTFFVDKSVYLNKCTDVRVYNNRFINCFFPVYLSGDVTTQCNNCKVWGNHFEHNVAAGSFTATFPAQVYVFYANDVIITYNSFKNIYSSVDSGTTGTGIGYGVYEGDGSCDSLTVVSNKFRYTGNGSKNAIAIAINQAVSATVTLNTIKANSSARLQNGILVDSKITGTTRNINNNTLENLQVDGVGGGKFGIYFNSGSAANVNVAVNVAHSNQITGFTNAIRCDFLGNGSFELTKNTCKSQLGAGISFNGASTLPIKRPIVHNNVILNSQEQGILFAQYVIRASVRNNEIFNGNLSNGAGDFYAAISFSTNSHGSTVTGNKIGNLPGGGGLFQFGIANAASAANRIYKDKTRDNEFIGINVANQQFSRFPAVSPPTSIFDAEYTDFVENVTLNAAGLPGWHCVIAKLLTMTVDSNNASASITVSATAGMLAGDIVLFTKTTNPDNGDYADTTKWHADTVLAIVDGTHFTLTTGIPVGDGTYVAGTALLKTARFKAAAAIAA